MAGVPAARVSLNTATVRAQWTLRQCIEGCARHGIGGLFGAGEVVYYHAVVGGESVDDGGA